MQLSEKIIEKRQQLYGTTRLDTPYRMDNLFSATPLVIIMYCQSL